MTFFFFFLSEDFLRYKLNVSYLVFLLLPPQFPSWTWCKISVHLKSIAKLALLKIFIQCLLFPLFIQEEGWERKVCIAKAGALWSDVLLILPISTCQGAKTRGCPGCTKKSLWLGACWVHAAHAFHVFIACLYWFTYFSGKLLLWKLQFRKRGDKEQEEKRSGQERQVVNHQKAWMILVPLMVGMDLDLRPRTLGMVLQTGKNRTLDYVV